MNTFTSGWMYAIIATPASVAEPRPISGVNAS
ncbi:MAG: hypothetical protein JWO49_433 [Arthrobacter sp.]|nr:hypothetical protein [Arthrobacter sp.]